MKLKTLLLLIAVLLLGMWLGVNIARKQPLFSNPFAEKTLSEKMRDATDDLLKNFK